MTDFEILKDLDPGKLTYDNFGEKGSYSCKIKIPISTYPIDIFFDTEKVDHLPTVKQRQFLNNLIADFDNLFAKTEAILLDTYINNSLLTTGNLRNDLQAVSLIIPLVDKGHTLWDATFKSKSNKNIFVIVYYDGSNPISAYIEKDERKRWLKFIMKLINRNS